MGGKAIPSNVVLGKLEKVLGVKLRGKPPTAAAKGKKAGGGKTAKAARQRQSRMAGGLSPCVRGSHNDSPRMFSTCPVSHLAAKPHILRARGFQRARDDLFSAECT